MDVQESLYDLILDKAYGNTNLVIEYIINNEKKDPDSIYPCSRRSVP